MWDDGLIAHLDKLLEASKSQVQDSVASATFKFKDSMETSKQTTSEILYREGPNARTSLRRRRD